MNSLELIHKIAAANNLTTGRAEMILSIIFEQISEMLKEGREVEIPQFGSFNVSSKKTVTGADKNLILFSPDKFFRDSVNT